MQSHVNGPPLRSQFLLDLRAALLCGPRQWVKGLEIEEYGDDRVTYESLAVVSCVRVRELDVYLQLTVWADHVAMFSVREDIRKRKYRVVARIPEFPVVADPTLIVETLQWSHSQLYDLDAPPGKSDGDHTRLQEIEARWLALAAAAAH